MKWSQFNFSFQSDKIGNCLYNSRMSSLIRLDEDSFRTLMTVADDPEKGVQQIDKETFDYLVRNKILVNDYEDVNYIHKLRYAKMAALEEKSNLSMVICPTLGCNFACPYCYEHDLKSSRMSADIQMKIINFINSYEGKKKGLVLNWHGGEPLSAFPTIKELYETIDKHSKLPITHSSMVSNGYLLTKDICDYLEYRKLDYLQITIDGNETTHNKTRILKNGKGTFNRIMENIDMATELMPNCRIGVRTNIGRHNAAEYPSIYRTLENRWKGKNVRVYYSFILNNSLYHKIEEKDSLELTTIEKCNFVAELAKEKILKREDLLPYVDFNSCTCTDPTAFVVDPEGLLYKCWADVGIRERSIGNLDEGIKNHDIVSQFVEGSDKYADPKCQSCCFLPICDGGCNLYRVRHQLDGKPYECCEYNKPGMQKILERFDQLK